MTTDDKNNSNSQCYSRGIKLLPRRQCTHQGGGSVPVNRVVIGYLLLMTLTALRVGRGREPYSVYKDERSKRLPSAYQEYQIQSQPAKAKKWRGMRTKRKKSSP